EICLKDMAGVGRPVTLGRLVSEIKKKYPKLIVQYHGHSGPGFSVASMLEVAKAGVDYVDVAMEPLSWGMVHPDVITIQAMLKDAGFKVPDINMKAYMKARALSQKFMDDFLGHFINPKNRYMSSLLVHAGLPGGMMGSMMADLKGVHQGLNQTLEAQGKEKLSEDDLLVKLFDEVIDIWPKLGNPPLVTPFSQYVKNIALLNVMQEIQGKAKFSIIDNNAWDMILGKAGKLPGQLAPEIIKIAEDSGKEFYQGVPQDNYPDELDKYRKEMAENNWDTGQDDEELFELAMHERQYRDYKSGVAKERFNEELQKIREEAKSPKTSGIKAEPGKKDIASPYMGRIFYNLNYFIEEQAIELGNKVQKGQRICYIENNYTYDEIVSEYDGEVDEIFFEHGDMVSKGDVIVRLK
ncbi:MAG: biotin/lipoyl-containing protein, partial [Bacteroidales bacterium]